MQKAQCMQKYQCDNTNKLIENSMNMIVVWYEIYVKNRKSSKMVNIDKHKGIDGYVSKSTDIINNKIKLTNVMSMRIGRVMCNIKNKTNMVNEKIHKASEMDNDNLNEIITYLIKGLRIIMKKRLRVVAVYLTHCHKTLGNTYSKNIRATIQIK